MDWGWSLHVMIWIGLVALAVMVALAFAAGKWL